MGELKGILFIFLMIVVAGAFVFSLDDDFLMASESSAVLSYNDDGKGLVAISCRNFEQCYQKVQMWKNDHPDHFSNVVDMTTGTYWGGMIIVYRTNPD